tara:strand:+ start:2878 stop:3186 length:309 start_codon:yes stop_codon:yes gene_type:complete
MKMYCTECGTPLEYTTSKPKFCSNCGYNFVTKTKASDNTLATPPPDNQNLDSVELDEYDVREIDPRIHAMTGLDVEITKDERKGVTFGQMFPNNETEEKKKK